jgi:hypothetical protein
MGTIAYGFIQPLKGLVFSCISMDIEDRKRLVRESKLEAWNDGTVDTFDDSYADGYVLHTAWGDQNLSEVKEMIRSVRSGTSDFDFQVDDLVSEGDRVVLRYTMGGTNTAPSYLTQACCNNSTSSRPNRPRRASNPDSVTPGRLASPLTGPARRRARGVARGRDGSVRLRFVLR